MSRHMAGPDAQEYPASLSGFADVQLFLLGLFLVFFGFFVCPFLGGIYYFDDAVIITSTVNLLSRWCLNKMQFKVFFLFVVVILFQLTTAAFYFNFWVGYSFNRLLHL